MKRETMKERFGRPLTEQEAAEYWHDAIPDQEDDMFASEDDEASSHTASGKRRNG